MVDLQIVNFSSTVNECVAFHRTVEQRQFASNPDIFIKESRACVDITINMDQGDSLKITRTCRSSTHCYTECEDVTYILQDSKWKVPYQTQQFHPSGKGELFID